MAYYYNVASVLAWRSVRFLIIDLTPGFPGLSFHLQSTGTFIGDPEVALSDAILRPPVPGLLSYPR